MINYENLIPKDSMLNISKGSIVNGKWFIGSALMGVNYLSLEQGNYYYYQDTIWARAIEMEKINPYWEIYNRTFNVLLINYRNADLYKFIKSFMENLLEEIAIDKKSCFFLSSNRQFIEILKIEKFNNIVLSIPFFIKNSLVGTYSKLFVCYDNKFYPLIDFTHFTEKNRIYFEISINKSYIEHFFLIKSKKKIKSKLENLYDYYLAFEAPKKEYISQDFIRFISLLDCAIHLNEQGYMPNSKYNGHITKKILKELYFHGEVVNLPVSACDVQWCEEYLNFFTAEEKKFKETYPRLVNMEYTEDLTETYGISKKIYNYIREEYKEVIYKVDKEHINYFTDIPFIEECMTPDNFLDIVRSIANKKY